MNLYILISVNVLQKPFSSLFNELKDEEIIIAKMGDVKYHQGYKTTLNNLIFNFKLK